MNPLNAIERVVLSPAGRAIFPNFSVIIMSPRSSVRTVTISPDAFCIILITTSMTFRTVLKIDNTFLAMFTGNSRPGMLMAAIACIFLEILRILVTGLAVGWVMPVESKILVMIECGRFPGVCAVAIVTGIAAIPVKPVCRAVLRMATHTIFLKNRR